MEIANEFSLSVPLDRAWPLLTDLARVAPAMPGATVTAVEPDGIRATMKVKVGPISVAYRVRVELVSADEATHVAVLRASGREARGQGTVEATVTARLRADGVETTAVALTTDLAVTGRVAQFGGGVMKEVADRLLRQFATRLEGQLEDGPAGAGAGAAGGAAAAGSGASAAGNSAGAAAQTAASAGEGGGSVAGAGGDSAGPGARPLAHGAPAGAAAEEEVVDLGRIAGAALLPSGPGVTAFAGAFLGTFLGMLLAALLLRKRG
jgi:carbon monoxide dehydrogenase subunit G